MTTVYYPTIIELAIVGYNASFPNLPGLASAGDSKQEITHAAEEAPDAHLELSIVHGERPASTPSRMISTWKNLAESWNAGHARCTSRLH